MYKIPGYVSAVHIFTYHLALRTVLLGPMAPSLKPPAGGFFYPPRPEQERVVDPTVHFSTLTVEGFLSSDCLVDCFILVIPSLNLVVSCPYVSYYLYMHTFMLFRSTCSGIFL